MPPTTLRSEAGRARAPGRSGGARAAAAVPAAVRRRRAAGVPRGAGRGRRRGRGRRHLPCAPCGCRTAPATVALDRPDAAHRTSLATLRLADPRDLGPAVARCAGCSTSTPTRWPSTPSWAPTRASPRRRGRARASGCPARSTAAETAVRAVLGQQVSVAAARTAAARLAAALGERLPPALAGDGPDLLFPTAGDRRRARRRGADRAGPADRDRASGSPPRSPTARSCSTPAATPRTCAPSSPRCPGIGPWTAGYLAMRVLGDPDELLAGDLAVRRGAEALGLPSTTSASPRAPRLGPVAVLRRPAPVAAPPTPHQEDPHDTARTSTLETPAGPFTAVVDADGAVLASGWTADLDILLPLSTRRCDRPRLRRMADLGEVSATRSPATTTASSAPSTTCPVRQRSGRVPRARLGGAADGAGRRARQLHGVRREGRAPGGGPGGGGGVRPQRGGAVRAVPPGAAHRRLARRVPLGAAGEAVAARPRGAG